MKNWIKPSLGILAAGVLMVLFLAGCDNHHHYRRFGYARYDRPVIVYRYDRYDVGRGWKQQRRRHRNRDWAHHDGRVRGERRRGRERGWNRGDRGHDRRNRR